MKYQLRRGFTLIELLIVIAIIGIISSIVIQALSNSRTKAYDSKIKQQLVGFRSAAEIYYNNQSPISYYNAGTLSSCTVPASGTLFTDLTTAYGSPGAYLVFTGLPSSPTVVCGANASAYAVKASLISGSGWCVDSTGKSETITTAQVAGSATVCP